MRYAFLASLLPSAYAAVVTVHAVFTPQAQTLTSYVQPDQVTKDETTTLETTLFVASSTPSTTAVGSVETTIQTTKANPVSQTDSYSQVQLATTVNPDTYTNGITIVTPTATATSASSTSSSSTTGSVTTSSSASTSSSDSKTTSPEASSTSSSSSVTTSSSSASTSSSSSSLAAAPTGGNYYSDGAIFSAIDTSDPLSMFAREAIPLTIPDGIDQSGPIQTNKFYANLFLDDQDLTVFAQPYNVFFSKDTSYYGFGVTYTNASQQVYGPDASADPVEYYTNPLMLKSFVFSAKEFGSADDISLEAGDFGPFSTTVTVKGSSGSIELPVAIGMGMVTGIYTGLTPRLFSQLGVQSLVQKTDLSSGVKKFRANLFNGVSWNVYVSGSGSSDFTWTVNSNFELVGSSSTDGIVVQVAVVPPGADDSAIDSAAGAYVTGAKIDGSVASDVATYSIDYTTSGTSSSGKPLLYALPHHVASFSADTKNAATSLTVYSGNKGYLTGVVASSLTMTEELYTDLQWLPYQDGQGSISFSKDALQLLAEVVNEEIAEDMVGQTDTTSTYTAGKGFDKFAYILLVASEVLGSDSVTKQGLESLKSALSPWLSNTQPTPFIYDTLFKGITSSAANNGGSVSDDFGAPLYNDHHFHYGYYVHAAAVIGLIDNKLGGTWVEDNKDWVNSLVRDVANPSTDDSHFPVFRMFDFFHGHSWAHGLFASGDGKDEESTSEDYNFAYGMKLWGQVSGDKAMEARGDLMLSIMKRSMDLYFYFKNDNAVQPSKILGNRVAGITFENKLDHTTYFGTNIEYIQGIHMIPITGASGLIRSKEFVQQEWDSVIAPILDNVDSGWTGILRSNQVLYDPTSAYEFFSQDNWNSGWLDGGASRTWYLTLAAALGGST